MAKWTTFSILELYDDNTDVPAFPRGKEMVLRVTLHGYESGKSTVHVDYLMKDDELCERITERCGDSKHEGQREAWIQLARAIVTERCDDHWTEPLTPPEDSR